MTLCRCLLTPEVAGIKGSAARRPVASRAWISLNCWGVMPIARRVTTKHQNENCKLVSFSAKDRKREIFTRISTNFTNQNFEMLEDQFERGLAKHYFYPTAILDEGRKSKAG